VIHHTFVGKVRRVASEIERITREGSYIYVEVPIWRKVNEIRNHNAVEVEPETLVWSKAKRRIFHIITSRRPSC